MRPHELILLAAGLALVACSGPQPADPVDHLRRGLSAQPETLDPQQARSVAALKVVGEMFEGLLTRDGAGQLVAGSAQSWQQSDDQLIYTFVLREELRWSDNSALTAEDFVRAWRYLADPKNAAFYAELLRPLRNGDDVLLGAKLPAELGVLALDPVTLQVTLDAPQPDFLQRVAHPALSPRARDGAALTNGAYVLANDNNAGRIELRANAVFHAAGQVSIRQVYYQAFDQELTEYNEFRSGGLDVTSRVPRQVFRTDTPEPTLRVAPYLGVVYLSFNMREPPPLSLRRALSLAIDREALASRVLGRGEQPAFGLVPPQTANGSELYPRFEHPSAKTDQASRQAEAVRLYEDVRGISDGPVNITLNYASSDENRVVAAALQAMWQRALPGIGVTLENNEFRVLLNKARSGDFNGLIRGSWIADYNDAGQFLALLTTDSAANTSGFSDARYDALQAAAETTMNPARRASALQAMEHLVAEQVPVIPLHYFVSKHMVRARVEGWQDNPLDLHYSRYLSLAPVRPEE